MVFYSVKKSAVLECKCLWICFIDTNLIYLLSGMIQKLCLTTDILCCDFCLKMHGYVVMEIFFSLFFTIFFSNPPNFRSWAPTFSTRSPTTSVTSVSVSVRPKLRFRRRLERGRARKGPFTASMTSTIRKTEEKKFTRTKIAAHLSWSNKWRYQLGPWKCFFIIKI